MNPDIRELLKNSLDSQALLTSGAIFGLKLRKAVGETAHDNVINLGYIPWQCLEIEYSDVPLGYEDEAECMHVLREKLVFTFETTGLQASNATARLLRLESLPENSKHLPELQISVDDSDNPDLVGTELKVRESLPCTLQFNMPRTFSGQLKRLLAFTFEIVESFGPIVQRSTHLTMGVMVMGNVMPKGVNLTVANHDTNAGENSAGHWNGRLSGEAKPFAPMSAVTYFDFPCYVISHATTLHGEAADRFKPPPKFAELLKHPDLMVGALYVQQLAEYVRHLRSNTLDHIMMQQAMVSTSDLVQKHAADTMSHGHCADILINQMKLMNLEEMQMRVDIAQYDLVYVQLSECIHQTPYSHHLIYVTLKVNGSSENRPKISLGDSIFLRPVYEDYKLLRKFGYPPAPMELQGVCVSYKLSTEEAVYEFPNVFTPAFFIKKRIHWYANQPHQYATREKSPHTTKWLLNELRFYVRFGYEQVGFMFVQRALRNIIHSPYFIECMFPSEKTIKRLVSVFRRPSSSSSSPSQQQQQQQGTPGAKGRQVVPPRESIRDKIERFLSQEEAAVASMPEDNDPALPNARSAVLIDSSSSSSSSSICNDGPPASASASSVAATPSGISLSTSSTFNTEQLRAIHTITVLAGNSRRNPDLPSSPFPSPFPSTATSAIARDSGDAPASKSEEPPYDFYPMPPFIIFGPPGTGKTSTVIESILRICRLHPEQRILACAPSDAAADVICDRLAAHLPVTKLLRLNWWQRVSASLPAKLRPYARDKDDLFEYPGEEELLSFQVVVCSCGTAGILRTTYKGLTSFDSVFVDEASQAIEAEVMVPLELCKKGGLMVLAGDPKQLGPTTRCPLYSICTDGASFQERLLRLPFYRDCWPERLQHMRLEMEIGSAAPVGENGKAAAATAAVDRQLPRDYSWLGAQQTLDSSAHRSAINLGNLYQDQNSKGGGAWGKKDDNADIPLGVFLYKNYRSHRAILEVPSRLFYGSALEECAHKSRTTLLTRRHWKTLTGRTNANAKPFPTLFVGVDGKHEHDTDSPSFYNSSEIVAVVDICRKLVAQGGGGDDGEPTIIRPKDIGVIAAFRQQVLKLRLALRGAGGGLSNVNVGSVEDFQGQEVRIVVISTVLSSWTERFETTTAMATRGAYQGAAAGGGAGSVASIGLIGCPQRFNVAVTRGMAQCIVVGQPYVLYLDPHWREWLKYCVLHDAYAGMPCEHFFRRRPQTRVDPSSLPSYSASTTTASPPSSSSSDALKEVDQHLQQKQPDRRGEGGGEEEGGGQGGRGNLYETDLEVREDLYDDDDDLLNSVVEVASAMLLGGGYAQQQAHPTGTTSTNSTASTSTTTTNTTTTSGGGGRQIQQLLKMQQASDSLRSYDAEWRTML